MPTFTFYGPRSGHAMLVAVVVGGGLHLDGVGPHVDEAGGGGAARDGGHPPTTIHSFTISVHPQPG